MFLGDGMLKAVIGTPVFMLALLLFIWFLAGWVAPSRAARGFVWLITALVLAGAVLAVAGVLWMGWLPPWQETGFTNRPASALEQVLLPAVTAVFIGIWLAASSMGGQAGSRWKFSMRHAALLVAAVIMYEAGMLFLGFPAPWNVPIPPQ